MTTASTSTHIPLVAALVALLATACGATTSGPLGQALGDVDGTAPQGVFVGDAVASLADSIVAGGSGFRPDAGTAGRIRSVRPSDAFVYGLRYDGCSHANPRLIRRSHDTVEVETDDLHRSCVRAMPVTTYVAVSWHDLDHSFTIGAAADPDRIRVQDRAVI